MVNKPPTGPTDDFSPEAKERLESVRARLKKIKDEDEDFRQAVEIFEKIEADTAEQLESLDDHMKKVVEAFQKALEKEDISIEDKIGLMVMQDEMIKEVKEAMADIRAVREKADNDMMELEHKLANLEEDLAQDQEGLKDIGDLGREDLDKKGSTG